MPESEHIAGILELVQSAFAYMEDRIDPPSSMHRLSHASIKEQCSSGEVWIVGQRPDACIFLTEKSSALYLGKLAVREEMRGEGLARRLVALAEDRAKSKGLSALELETRIELSENHKTFGRLGFVITGEGCHDGYDRPTFVIMRKELGA